MESDFLATIFPFLPGWKQYFELGILQLKLPEKPFNHAWAGTSDEEAERIVPWSPIANELADFTGVTPLLESPAELSQRGYGFETHEHQSEENGAHGVAWSAFSRVGVLNFDLGCSYAYISLGE